MRFSVREPAANGRADTRRDVRIDDVEIQGDVDERSGRDPLERLAQDRLDASTVDVRDRVYGEARVLHDGALAGVEAANADQRDAVGVEGRERPPVALEAGAGAPEDRRERHPVNVAARRRRGRVQVAVRVEPEHAAGPCSDASAPIVPSATEWSPPRTSGVRPPSAAERTCSAIRSHVWRISERKRASWLPGSIVSRIWV